MRRPLTNTAHVSQSPLVRSAGAVLPPQRLLLLLLLLVLTGCGTHSLDALQPVAMAPVSTAKVNMLVVTTRKRSADPAELYTGDRGTAISFDSLAISIPPESRRMVGEVQWPRGKHPDPARDFAVLDVDRLETNQQLLAWIRHNRSPRRRVLIFVHGFNNTYSDAVFRFAQIVHDAHVEATPILFTWPSRGRVIDYLYDRESASYSRAALEDLIIAASGSPDVDEVTILAHSMGTWLTSEALRGVAMRQKRLPAKIRNVVLASPDLDMDVFRRQFIEMGPQRPHFTIFTSTKDKALGVSRWLGGGVDRLGGTDLSAHAPVLERLGVSVVDTSAIDPRDPLGHNAFADSPEMIGLLGKRLAGQRLDGGRVRIADRVRAAAAHRVSAAASAAAAATVALVERHRSPRRKAASAAAFQNGGITY